MKILGRVFLFCLLFSSSNVFAQNVSLISDEETEVMIQNIARPIYKAADVNFNQNNFYIVNDDSLNAFVGDGNRMFINTGTIIKAKHKDELRGVIAHETGHILGGHILRLKIKNNEMQQATLASMVLAGVAGVAAGRGDVAAAIALGSQSSLMTHYTIYRQEEERSADESAVKLLAETQKSPAGMRDFMKSIQSQNIMSGVEESPYFRTHPVTTERISFMEEAVKQSPYPQSQDDGDFLRVQAKLVGYLYEPSRVFARYPLSDNSIPAKYARSIIYFRQMNLQKANAELDDLIKLEPNNPYFRELRAQIYLETGQVKQAKQEYKKALDLRPNSALFQQNLAQATLEDNPTKAELENVVTVLNKSIITKPSAYSWLLLSRAYGMLDNTMYSNYAASEYSFRIGAIDVAKKQAEIVKKMNPPKNIAIKVDDMLAEIDEIEKDMPMMNNRRR